MNFRIAFLLILSSQAFSQGDLEQFLSHPVESGFTCSLDGKNIAWVINDHGKRNIIVKTANDPPRFVTDFQMDDGQESLTTITHFHSDRLSTTCRSSGFICRSQPHS